MKKTIALLLSAILVLSMFGCGTPADDTNDKLPVTAPTDNIPVETAATPEVTTIPTTATPDAAIEPQVIYEKDGIRITANSLDTDDFFGPAIKVLIENDSSQNITVQAWNSSINGLMVDNMFSCDVAAGKKANDTITFMASELEMANITVIQSICFSLSVFDSDSWEDIDQTDIITITTSADPSYIQTFDDSGFVAYEGEGIRIIVQKLNSSDSFWGSDLYIYAENNTASNITIQATDVSVNGFMVDPVFSCDITAGNKAYDTITFFESDLEDNGITDITEMDIKFYIFDSESWMDIHETDVVTITFN